MSMKPIASRTEGRCFIPVDIKATTDGKLLIITSVGREVLVALPGGLTPAQFLDQYNRCTDNIYFID